MGRKIQESEYAALAEFRYRIRQFLHGSDETARAVGLEPQQYQLLLAARTFKNQREATIRRLAERFKFATIVSSDSLIGSKQMAMSAVSAVDGISEKCLYIVTTGATCT